MALIDEYRRQAEQALKPSLDLGLNRLALDESGLGQQEAQVGQNYDRTIRDLEEAARTQQGSFEERQNQLGLLQSGLTSTGLGKIQSDLFRGRQETAQDKANRLADLALQRAGLGIQRQQLQQTYTSSIGDLVQKLLDQEETRKKSAASAGGFGSKTMGILGGGNGPAPQAAPAPTPIPEAVSIIGGDATQFRQYGGGLNVQSVAQYIIPEISGLSTAGRVKFLKEMGFSVEEIRDIMESFNEQITPYQTYASRPRQRGVSRK